MNLSLPFPGGLDALPNGTLLFSLVAAGVYALICHWSPRASRTAVKTLAVGLLALLAFLMEAPVVLVGLLALCALGDFYLAQDGDGAFLGGLGSFLAGHVGYVVLFAIEPVVPTQHLVFLTQLGLSVAQVAFAGAMTSKLFPAVDKALRWPVVCYIVAILAMGLAAVWLQSPIVVAGALLFMLSDSLLATGRFLLRADDAAQRWLAPAVWVTYYAAQLILALAFILRIG